MSGIFCNFCNSPGELSCGRCFDTYCSVKCQRDDWPRHRYNCVSFPSIVPRARLSSNPTQMVARAMRPDVSAVPVVQPDESAAKPSPIKTVEKPKEKPDQKPAEKKNQDDGKFKEANAEKTAHLKSSGAVKNELKEIPEAKKDKENSGEKFDREKRQDNQTRDNTGNGYENRKPNMSRDRFSNVARNTPKEKLEIDMVRQQDNSKVNGKVSAEVEDVPMKKIKLSVPAKTESDLKSIRSLRVVKEKEKPKDDDRIMLADVEIIKLPTQQNFSAKLTNLSLFFEQKFVSWFECSERILKLSEKIPNKIAEYVKETKDLNAAGPYRPINSEIVLALFEGEYCRALITEDCEKDKDEYKVQYIDYGNDEVTSSASMRKLPKSLAAPIYVHYCLVRNFAGDLNEKVVEVMNAETVEIKDAKQDKINQCMTVEIVGLD